MYLHTQSHTYMHVCKYIYIYIFIIQRVKARAIPCPHQPPSRGDDTVSVAQGGTATPYQAAFATGQGIKRIIYIYIYIR